MDVEEIQYRIGDVKKVRVLAGLVHRNPGCPLLIVIAET